MPTFACQRCKAPLRLDDSLKNLNPASFDLLLSGTTSPTQQQSQQQSAIPPDRLDLYERSRRGLPPSSPNQLRKPTSPNPTGDMSFVLLSDSQLPSTPKLPSTPTTTTKSPPPIPSYGDGTLSSQLQTHQTLFTLLSSHSEIDHPLCTECTDILLSHLTTHLASITKERDAFIAHLKSLKQHTPTPADITQATESYKTALEAQKTAMHDLLAAEAEKEDLERELADLQDESRALDAEEAAFWRERNALDLEIRDLEQERDALVAACLHDEAQLERLRRTNVYNDTFCVGHDGHFGTINGLRLGRLPPPNHVEWAEVNAAWGVTALLVVTVAERLGCVFRGYRIRPMGSATRIERLAGEGDGGDGRRADGKGGKPVMLELFSSGDLPIGKSIMHRRFNEAMVAFLGCVRQLAEFIREGQDRAVGGGQDGGFKLMYDIGKDTVREVSIRLGVSSDEQWTAACKYLLTDCKLLLAHMSNAERRS